MRQRRMRYLRLKHNISIIELANYADVSNQRLSQIELEEKPATTHMNRLLEAAFAHLIAAERRELDELEADLACYRGRLLEYVPEGEKIP